MLKRMLRNLALLALFSLPIFAWPSEGAETWRDLKPKERENVLRNYRRWQNLPPQDKDYLREEWNRWQSLPPDRRDQLKRRYDDLRRRRPDN
jgi:hypothetical protein